MVVVLLLLALVMIATGAAAVSFGFPVVEQQRGWSMVIAGSGVASAGAVLLGLAGVSYGLSRVRREVRRLGDRIARAGQTVTAVPDDTNPTLKARPEPVVDRTRQEEAVRPRIDDVEPLAPEPPSGRGTEPPAGAVVVGRYASGGNSYVMYSDGSVHADTPSGHHRFGSLDELKRFVASGGESLEAAAQAR